MKERVQKRKKVEKREVKGGGKRSKLTVHESVLVSCLVSPLRKKV